MADDSLCCDVQQFELFACSLKDASRTECCLCPFVLDCGITQILLFFFVQHVEKKLKGNIRNNDQSRCSTICRVPDVEYPRSSKQIE
jgi:hypothetical protein